MHLIRLETAVILGIVIPQISSISISHPPSDCLAAVETCMSNLCRWSEEALYGAICEDEGCQIKGSEGCNLTIQTVMDQFPSLQGCVCAWKEEELCDSIQALATQCKKKTAAQHRRSTPMDWQSSSLIGYVPAGSASCLHQMSVCVSDTVCNSYLAPVLKACMMQQCDRCQQMTQQFYSRMLHNVAEMLGMCECEASDQTCLDMKADLHSGTCGSHTWICQDTVRLCVEDRNCRDLLKIFQAKCWSPEEVQCSDGDLQNDECIAQMNPALILGADPECKIAFLATLGTTLHSPCSCEGLHNEDLLTCNRIHDVLHNRSYFMTSWRSSSGPTKPPEIDESEQGHTWSHDYLLYAFATVLLFGVVILLPLAVVCKIWMLRRREKAKFHHPQKNRCVVIL